MKTKQIKSIFLILLWALTFTLSMTFLKCLKGSVPTVALVFTRSIFGCVLSGFLLTQQEGGRKNLRTQRLPLHLFRILLGILGLFCTYYTYSHLPLALATTIGFTGPLITTLMALVFLQETITWKRWIGIFVGYMGVLLIIQPGEGAMTTAIAVALMANICAGGSIIAAKKLSGTDHPAVIMAFSNGVNFLLMVIPTFLLWKPLSWEEMGLLTGVCLMGSLSQYLQISAIRLAKPSFLAPFEYFRLIYALPIGWFFFQESLSTLQLLGSLVIMAGTYAVTQEEKVFSSSKKSKLKDVS